jgi:hypothetical protein
VAESSGQSGSRTHSLIRTTAKRALAPLLASAVSAASAYLTRKASALAQEKLLPKLQEKGGGRAVAHDALTAVAEKAPEPVSGPIESLAEKVEGEETGREAQRKGRQQRRTQRRRTLEQSAKEV